MQSAAIVLFKMKGTHRSVIIVSISFLHVFIFQNPNVLRILNLEKIPEGK